MPGWAIWGRGLGSNAKELALLPVATWRPCWFAAVEQLQPLNILTNFAILRVSAPCLASRCGGTRNLDCVVMVFRHGKLPFRKKRSVAGGGAVILVCR
eukprot:365391-Chlamydomonas_euryale.AAC.9